MAYARGSRTPIALLLIVAMTSCATVRNGPSESISVMSTPAGADASIQCANEPKVAGTTPSTVTLPRVADGCVLEVSKAGYKTARLPLERGYNKQFWLNFVPAGGIPAGIGFAFGGAESAAAVLIGIGVAGAIGFAVDRVSGRGYGHQPDRFAVTLEPAQ